MPAAHPTLRNVFSVDEFRRGKSWQRDFASPWHDQILSANGCRLWPLVKFIDSVISSIVLNSVTRIVRAAPGRLALAPKLVQETRRIATQR